MELEVRLILGNLRQHNAAQRCGFHRCCGATRLVAGTQRHEGALVIRAALSSTRRHRHFDVAPGGIDTEVGRGQCRGLCQP